VAFDCINELFHKFPLIEVKIHLAEKSGIPHTERDFEDINFFSCVLNRR
jgi:hypothetical protein